MKDKINRLLFPALFSIALAIGNSTASCAEDNYEPLYSEEQHCGKIINTTNYTIFGMVSTNYYLDQDNEKSRYTVNFRLAAGEEWPVCTTGPFYEGYKVDLQIKTLVPVFDCRTAVTGDILVKSIMEDDVTKTFAECL